MRDRLAELPAAPAEEAAPVEATKTKGKDSKGKDKGTEMDAMVGGGGAENAFMSDFFSEVGAIKDNMATIRRNIRSIKELANDIVVGTSGDEASARKSKELNDLVDASNKIVSNVRQKLEDMKNGNKTFQDSSEATPAEIRIRMNMHSTLVTKFVDLMKAYNDVQTDYQASTKERLTRQCKVVRPELEDAEIKEIVESGDTQVFASAILDKDITKAARDALQFVEKKHNDILRLQQSINELHQMFLDMATLVQSQGELVDQIEANCNSAEAYMEEAVQQLRKANKLQRKSRKKMIIIIVIIVIILVVIGVISGVLGKLL